MIIVLGVFVVLVISSVDRSVISFSLNNATKDVFPQIYDPFSTDAFVEEVTAKVTPLQKIKPIDPVQKLKYDSNSAASERNSESVAAANDDKNSDNITQLQKQYKGKKGHKSAKFGEKKGHKKGHKTRGYNNRFHKDEYVKEHKLYGDGYGNNHRSNYKNGHDVLGKKSSETARATKHSHGHRENKFGKKGDEDVGKFDKRHQDFERDSKHQQYNNQQTRKINLKEVTNPYPNHRPY